MKLLSTRSIQLSVGISLCVAVFASLHARSCGTAWTDWVSDANPEVNPCPKGCVRGDRVTDRTHKQGGKLLYQVQYQCQFAATPPSSTQIDPNKNDQKSSEATSATTSNTTPTSTTTHSSTISYPFIKGSPAEAGGATGVWIDWDDMINKGHGLRDEAVRKAWQTNLQALAGVLRDSPAMNPLGGYYPRISVSVSADEKPVPQAGIHIGIWNPAMVEPDPNNKQHYRIQGKYLDSGPGGYSVYINRMPTSPVGRSEGLQTLSWGKDDADQFYVMPPAERSLASYPVLAGYLFVTAAGKPPLFVPVSQERAHKAAIAWARAQITEVGTQSSATQESLNGFNSPEMKKLRQQVIDEAGAREKDPNRAAQARAKAQADDAEQERQLRALVASDPAQSPMSQAANALVKNYFNTAAPAGSMQLLVMSVGSLDDWEGKSIPPQSQPLPIRVPLAIAEQTDWRKAATLLR